VHAESRILRPVSGIVLTLAMWVLGAVALVSLVWLQGWLPLVAFAPIIVAACYWVWLLFWYPRIVIEPGGVEVRNPFRTFHVSWPAITDVDTRWALTIRTAGRRVEAWSAPASGRYAAGVRAAEVRGVPVERRDGMVVVARPSDLPSSSSGLAGLVIRRTWESIREQGWLDSGAVEGSGVRVRTPAWPLVVAIALPLVALVAALSIQ